MSKSFSKKYHRLGKIFEPHERCDCPSRYSEFSHVIHHHQAYDWSEVDRNRWRWRQWAQKCDVQMGDTIMVVDDSYSDVAHYKEQMLLVVAYDDRMPMVLIGYKVFNISHYVDFCL